MRRGSNEVGVFQAAPATATDAGVWRCCSTNGTTATSATRRSRPGRARAPDFESVFIDDDAALEARYGLRVPVLRDAAGERELDWPFDAARVRAFLAAR